MVSLVSAPLDGAGECEVACVVVVGLLQQQLLLLLLLFKLWLLEGDVEARGTTQGHVLRGQDLDGLLFRINPDEKTIFLVTCQLSTMKNSAKNVYLTKNIVFISKIIITSTVSGRIQSIKGFFKDQ